MSTSGPSLAIIAKLTALLLLSITVTAYLARPQYLDLSTSRMQMVLHYGVGAKNVLDTYSGTFTKDMIVDPSITIKMVLTENELSRVETKLAEVGFFNKSDWDLRPHSSVSGSKTPYSTYYLKVSLNGVAKELRWNHSHIVQEGVNGPAMEVVDLLRMIIEARTEYQGLPEPRGGYA